MQAKIAGADEGELRSILIVDRALARGVKIKLLLENMGRYRVVQVTTVAAARQRLKEESFALVIAAQELPDGAGVGLAGEVARTALLNKPYFLLVGASACGAAKKAAGVDDVVGESLDQAELKLRIKRGLRCLDYWLGRPGAMVA